MSKYTKNLKDVIAEIRKKDEVAASNGSKDFSKDYWKFSLGKDEEEAEAIIHFLPFKGSATGIPWVPRPAHMIRFSNGSFIYEPCLRKKAVKEKCPICEKVNDMYQSGSPAMEKVGSQHCTKARYFQWIYVVKDTRDGGVNEGKVFIYEHGVKIFDKCYETIMDTDDAINYHDPIDGANFKLRLNMDAGFQNYDKSKFLKVGRIADKNGVELTDEQIDKLLDQCYNLEEKLLNDKAYKTYDELASIYKNQGYSKQEKTTGVETKIAPEKSITTEKKQEVAAPVKTVEKPAVKADDFKPTATDDDDDAELQRLLSKE